MLPLLQTPLAAVNTATEQSTSAPFPVPTEAVQEPVVEIQCPGVKVRDFVQEQYPVELRAPELFDPILGWHVYETVLDNPNPERGALNAKHLRRLLDLGWVSEEADGHRWQEKDREALRKFDSRPSYPWKALNLTKPQKHELKDVAISRFQWVNAEQLVSQFVNRGSLRVTPVLRRSRHATAQYQKRQANDDAGTVDHSGVSPLLKKRRLSLVADSESQPAPNFAAQLPLLLVNGKLPQHFPPGHPPGSPSRLTSLSTQGTLSRSLQHRLSISPHPSPDARTTLTQSASRV